VVHYQDMTQNLEHEATRLAQFLGVEEQRWLATVVEVDPYLS
jgi:hypothetical protein